MACSKGPGLGGREVDEYEGVVVSSSDGGGGGEEGSVGSGGGEGRGGASQDTV